MGGGVEEDDLYTGTFDTVDVVNDAWYNTDLLFVQVAGAEEVKAARVPAKYAKTMISNSIVDSGTNSLALANDVFQAIVSSLGKLNPDFGNATQTASREPVQTDALATRQVARHHVHAARRGRSPEFLGEPDEKSFGPAYVAEPIRVFVLDHFAADKLRAVLAEPGERVVDVVHSEHDA
jgi:hypothetical protein